jgi:hypothetical protein
MDFGLNIPWIEPECRNISESWSRNLRNLWKETLSSSRTLAIRTETEITPEADMKKSINLALTDEELLDLERILLDGNGQEALQFLKKHLERQVKAAISGEGH